MANNRSLISFDRWVPWNCCGLLIVFVCESEFSICSKILKWWYVYISFFLIAYILFIYRYVNKYQMTQKLLGGNLWIFYVTIYNFGKLESSTISSNSCILYRHIFSDGSDRVRTRNLGFRFGKCHGEIMGFFLISLPKKSLFNFS